MKAIKHTITGDMAHFKRFRSPLVQQSYKTIPISTVIGILKNIYGEDIKNFIFGYNFSYVSSEFEVETIWKRTNVLAKIETPTQYPSQIEYLINPVLEILTIGLNDPIQLQSNLNFGKTTCLAEIKFSECEVIKEQCLSKNIITLLNDGDGIIERQNIETYYDESIGVFRQITKPVRINQEFACDYTYDGKGIYLMKYKGVGDIECCKE